MKNRNTDVNDDGKEPFPWGIIRFSILLMSILALLLWYSFREKEIRVYSTEIKQNTLSSFFRPMNDFIGFLGIRYLWNSKTVVDSTRQRILIAGDSMSGFLRLRLNDYCEKNGHSMYSVVWNSGNTIWFAETDTLTHFIEQFKPTYVLIVLGANELSLPRPEYRQKHIDRIINKIGDIPFIWIGPPNWEKDSGINNIILKSVGRKRFFPSLNLEYDRMSDGAHPTRQSAYNWMDSIAVFMMTKARHPILMDFPEKNASKHPPTTVLDPLRSNRESKELSIDPEILNEIN